MDVQKIDRYLFNEMSETERDQFEASFLNRDELFYEIADRENDLVDRYLSGDLESGDRQRFEASLVTNPARRQKIANAGVMREFIAENRGENKTITIAERSGFFATLAELLSFKSPAFQFASIGLIAILALGLVFLLMENRRLGPLQQELAAARERESQLASQVENERDAAGDLTADLNAERERIEKLEADLAALRDKTGNDRPATNIPPPTIAALVLSPVSIRGPGRTFKRLDLAPGVRRISIVVNLPDMPAGEHTSVRLNGEPVAERVRVRGNHTVVVTVGRDRVKTGRNNLEVFDAGGKRIAEHDFVVTEAKDEKL